MATTLKTLVQFLNVAPGASVTLPHRIKIPSGGSASGERDIRPDIGTAFGTQVGQFTFVNVGQDQIQATNIGVIVGTVTLLCEYWHTIERDFGAVVTVQLQAPTIFVYSGGASPTANCGTSIAAGANKAAEINAAITSASALWAVDGQVRRVTLGCGITTIETNILVKSGVEYFQDDGAIVVPTFAGAPNDPLNASVLVKGTSPGLVNTGVTAITPVGSLILPVAGIGGMAVGMFLMVSGINTDPQDMQIGSVSSGANCAVRHEILQIDASWNGVTLNVPLVWPTKLHWGTLAVSGITVVDWVPVVDAFVSGGYFDHVAGSNQVACAVTVSGCINVPVKNIGARGCSRAVLDLENGAMSWKKSISDITADEQCNGVVRRVSAHDGVIERVRPNARKYSVHALGIPQHQILAEGRCSYITERDFDLLGGWGAYFHVGDVQCKKHRIWMDQQTITDAIYNRKVAAGINWVNGGIYALGMGSGYGPVPPNETSHDNEYVDIGVGGNMFAPSNGAWQNPDGRPLARTFFTHDTHQFHFNGVHDGDIGIGSSHVGALDTVGGWTTQDCSGIVDRYSGFGRNYQFCTLGGAQSLRYGSVYLSAGAGVNAPTAVIACLFDNDMTLGGDIYIEKLEMQNFTIPVVFDPQWIGSAGLRIHVLEIDNRRWTDAVVVNGNGTAFAQGQIGENDPASAGSGTLDRINLRTPTTGLDSKSRLFVWIYGATVTGVNSWALGSALPASDEVNILVDQTVAVNQGDNISAADAQVFGTIIPGNMPLARSLEHFAAGGAGTRLVRCTRPTGAKYQFVLASFTRLLAGGVADIIMIRNYQAAGVISKIASNPGQLVALQIDFGGATVGNTVKFDIYKNGVLFTTTGNLPVGTGPDLVVPFAPGSLPYAANAVFTAKYTTAVGFVGQEVFVDVVVAENR